MSNYIRKGFPTDVKEVGGRLGTESAVHFRIHREVKVKERVEGKSAGKVSKDLPKVMIVKALGPESHNVVANVTDHDVEALDDLLQPCLYLLWGIVG